MSFILLFIATSILVIGSGLTLSGALFAVEEQAHRSAIENDVDPDMLSGLVKAFILTYHFVSVVCILAAIVYLYAQGRQ